MCVRKEKFIFVESVENHNKFWYIEQHEDGMIRTIWGRVGCKEVISEKQFGSAAGKEYDRLVKSKLKKGYVRLRTIDNEVNDGKTINSIQKKQLEDIALAEIDYDKSDSDITNIIKVFCRENIHAITTSTNIIFNSNNNVFQTPCGIVTIEAVNDARNILNTIYDCVRNNDFSSSTFVTNVEMYCAIIPQKIRGKLICTKIFGSLRDVQKQNDILDALKDSIETIEQLSKTQTEDSVEKTFKCSIKKVSDRKIIEMIKNLYYKTHQNMHACRNLKIKTVYAINIDKMSEQFEHLKEKWEALHKKLNLMQLWHGTKKQNIISILKNGMIIPPSNASHCCGRMFGNYLYFSDQSTKSLNYAYGWWSGTRDSNCFMFLNDVLMGNAYTPTGSCGHIPSGYDSIFAKAHISGVQNNEMMVNPNQVCPKFLIEFTE